MYASFTPEQMGIRASRVFKREGDNRYVFPPSRKRMPSAPAVRRNADGRVVAIFNAKNAPARLSAKTAAPARVAAKRTLPEHAYGRPCVCAQCKVYAKRSVGTVEHATKDHL